MPSRHTASAAAAVLLLLSIGGAVADRPNFSDNAAFAAFVQETHGVPHQTFRSSDIIAPIFQVNSWDHSQTDDSSFIFIGGAYGNKKAAPMILSGKDLSLVYADQQYDQVYTSSVQTFNGTKYLTFWEGPHDNTSSVDGHWLMFDGKYELKYNFTAPGSRHIRNDMPDMRVTRDNTILLATYETIAFDCSEVGGVKEVAAPLQDSGFREIDPLTSKVLFEWRAREHFNLSDSYASYDEEFGVGSEAGFDFFHLSSVEKSEDGNYLVSSSHFSALFMVHGQDGHVMWTLGGKKSDFEDVSGGNATNFKWLHDAQLISGNNEIILFDNHGQTTEHCTTTTGNCTSRGLRIRLDNEKNTVELVHEFLHPQGAVVNSAHMGGGVQLLKDGHTMVAWGNQPAFVEYNKAGMTVMDIQAGKMGVDALQAGGGGMSGYRVSRHRWQGEPSWPPSVAVDAAAKSTINATVYVSWNGATDVAQWAILASDAATAVGSYKNVIATANRTGFETAIQLDDTISRRYIGAAAISSSGDVMGSSFVFDMRTGKAVMQPSGITSINPPVKATAAAGAMGGSIFGISMLFYVSNYFWRRKGGAMPATGEHTTTYEKVGGSAV